MTTKKKTRSMTTAAPKTSPIDHARDLAARVGALFARDGDGDPEKIGDLIRDRLGVTKAVFSRWQSGDELPDTSKLELLEKLCEANADTKPGEPAKPRTEPTERESKLLERVEFLADLTKHQAWREIADAINRKDAALTESLRDCKPTELRGIQGGLEILEWLRDRVCQPARELADMPLFAASYVVKADPKKLSLTVSAR